MKEVCLWCGGDVSKEYEEGICPHCGQRIHKVLVREEKEHGK